MSINVRRLLLSGRHLLAAEKPLTKFAISLGEAAPTAPRAPTRKTGVWKAPPPAVARARQPPRQEKPQLLGAPPPPPCTQAHSRTHARAHTHVHTTKGSRASRVRRFARALMEAPPPGPHRAARGLLTCWSAPRGPVGARIPEARGPPDRPRPAWLCSAALAGSCGCSGPTTHSAPPAAEPSAGKIPPGRAWAPNRRAPYLPGFSGNKTITLNYPW